MKNYQMEKNLKTVTPPKVNAKSTPPKYQKPQSPVFVEE
jgi:hypothetical protein